MADDAAVRAAAPRLIAAEDLRRLSRRSNPRGAAPDQGFRRFVGCPDRDIGIALRQVQGLVAGQDIEPDIRAALQEAGEDRGQQAGPSFAIPVCSGPIPSPPFSMTPSADGPA